MTLEEYQRLIKAEGKSVTIRKAIEDDESEYDNYIAFIHNDSEEDKALFLIVNPETNEIVEYDDGE